MARRCSSTLGPTRCQLDEGHPSPHLAQVGGDLITQWPNTEADDSERVWAALGINLDKGEPDQSADDAAPSS